MKTTRFTILGHDSFQGCVTTGFHENASHARMEAARQVSGISCMMAVLADYAVREMNEAIDF